MARKIPLLDAAQLLPEQGRCVEAEGIPLAVFRTAEGLFAIEDECPHMGASLGEGWVERGEAGPAVVCPQHLWHFRLAEGTGTTAPGSCVRTFAVEENAGKIWITLD